MLNYYISTNEVLFLADQVKSTLTFRTIQRGLDYAIKGRVFNIVVHNNIIQATVQGNYNYLVNLNLDNFELSRCSCPVQVHCKHLAALFFYLYALYEKPENFIQKLNSEQYSPNNEHNRPWQREQSPLVLPASTGSLEQWSRYFDNQYTRMSKTNYNNVNYNFYQLFLDALTNAVQTWPSPAKDFFMFHGGLFAMDKMEKVFSQQIRANQIITFLMDSAENFSSPQTEQNHQEHFIAALDKLRQMLLQENTACFDWLFIYRLLWSNRFSHEPLIVQEIQHLDKLLKEKRWSPNLRYNINVARAHFYFITGHEGQAMKTLDKTKARIGDILFYLRAFAHHEQWDRLLKWLRWLTPRMTYTTYNEFNEVCKYWQKAAKGRQEYTELLQVLKSWLPRSNSIYGESLILAGQYKSWVNLQIYNQCSPADISREDLKIIEAVDVALLLPLYHQFVIRLIQEKNRHSYKYAVRMLKKLRTYYKKLKVLDDWDRFIARLTVQHSRLRALKEELRKGKLIV